MEGRFGPIAERYVTVVHRGEHEWMCTCPFCEGKSSLQFNVDSGLWSCFRCDARGNAPILAKRMGGTYADPVIGTEHIRAHMDRIRIKRKKADQGSKVLEERYLTAFGFPDEYWEDERGFSKETVAAWDLGYDPMKDRNTIAYRNEHGDLLGIIYRLKGDVFPRYIYPEGFNRRGSLFGSWKVNTRRVALVEGSTDVLGLFEASRPAVAQYGSSITREQVRLLHRLGIREVVLFYDYDEAGRKAEERSREVIDGIVLYRVRWNTGKYCWHKKLCGCGQHDWRTIAKCQKKKLCKCGRIHEMDPGSLSIKERQKMFDNAELIGSKKWTRKK